MAWYHPPHMRTHAQGCATTRPLLTTLPPPAPCPLPPCSLSLGAATVESLREDVTASSWFAEFQGDLRNSVVAALRGGWRGVGSAGSWTARNILSPAAVPFRSCYSAGRGMRRALTGPVEVAGGEEEGDGEGRSCMLPAMPKSDRRAFDRGPMEDGDLGRPLLGEEGSLGGLDQEEATTSVPGHVGVGVGAKTARRTSLSLRGWIPGSEGGGGLRGGPVAASAPDLSAASKAGMQGRSSISYQQGQGVIAEEGSGMRHWYGHDNDALPPPHLPLSESVMEEALRSCLYAAADSEEGALSRMGLGLGGRSPRRGAPSPQPRPGAPGHHRHRGSSTPGDGIAEAEAEAVRELDPQAGVQAALQLLGDAGPQHRRNGSRGGRPRAQQHQQPAQGVDSTEGSGQGSLQQAVKRRLWPWGWGAALGKPALGQAGDLQGQGEPVQGGGGDGSTGGDVPQRGSGWGWWRAGAGGDMGHSSSSPSSSAPLIPPNGPALPTSTSAHDHEGDLSTAVGAQGPGVAQRAAQTAGSWLLGNMFNSCAAPRRHGAGASGAAGPGSDVQRRPASSRPPSHTDSYGDVFMLADNGAGASIIMGGGGGYVPPKAPLHADSSTGPRRGGRDRELSSDGTREEEDGDEEDGENDTELVGMDLAGGASLPEGDPTGVAGAASRAAMHQQLQAGITAVVAAVTREGNSREQAGEESGADETMGAAGHAAYMDVDGEGPHHAHPQPSGQGKGWWFPSRTQQTKHGVDGGAAAAQHPRDDGIARETALPSTNAPGSVGMAREADGSGGGAAPHRTHSCASGAAAGAAGAGGVRSPTSIVPKRLYPAGRILHFFPVHDLEGPAAAAAEAAAAAAGGAQVSGTGTAGHHASHTASHTQAHAREPEAPQAQAQAQQSEVEAGAAASRAEAASHTGAPSESGEADAQAQTAVPSEEVGAPAPAPAPASPAGATVAVGLGPAPCAQPGPANIAGAIASMAKAGATATTGNTDAAVRAAVASAAPGADGLLPATVQPAPGQRWVLHRADNHRAYGRLKLCRTMVMDHFVFSYLQALDSVVEQLQVRGGKGCRREHDCMQHAGCVLSLLWHALDGVGSDWNECFAEDG